jgi:hypothetical protein
VDEFENNGLQALLIRVASSLNVMGLKNMALPILGIIYENS